MKKDLETLEIQLPPEVAAELRYLVELHEKHGAPNPQTSVESLIVEMMGIVAAGSRRPCSWERGTLASAGLVANCDEHRRYRRDYGRPAQKQEPER
ncbi:hypothetical protein [Desulfobulbus elongatus]|uniref:hypothetical protein n=1 Tax=Desulfobulbus elongatus TaxID=53332 RepID=UPI000486CE96|nr:hypothetical protein [Desulfobulbus elongatus]